MSTRHINSISVIVDTNDAQQLTHLLHSFFSQKGSIIFDFTNESRVRTYFEDTLVLEREEDRVGLFRRESSPSPISR
jgi:hypothetical protein